MIEKEKKMANKVKKYKQTEIPKVTIIENRDLGKYMSKFYAENLQGKSVVNKDLGMTITFTSVGKNEISYGRALYAKKAAIITCLEKLMEVAEYNNFGERKETDKKNIIGYLNFKAKVLINDKLENVRITVQFKKDGKMYFKPYYNHEINIKK